MWKRVKKDCAQGIDSLFDLLQGRFDEGVMRRMTDPKDGLFPHPEEIDLDCSCPDWAVLCKHVAAVLYGIGARLDTVPELLFTLRGVDHTELIGQAVSADNLEQSLGGATSCDLAMEDLGEIFGIELDASPPAEIGAAKRSLGPKSPEGSNIPAEPVPALSKKKPTSVTISKTPKKKVIRVPAQIGVKKLSSTPANSAGRKSKADLPTSEIVSALRKPARR